MAIPLKERGQADREPAGVHFAEFTCLLARQHQLGYYLAPALIRPAPHAGNLAVPSRLHPEIQPELPGTLRLGADRWADMIASARQLADAYDVTDTDGSRPDCWGYLAADGWEREDGEGVDRFR